MRRVESGIPMRTDIWREGKYLDLWSVPHFLSGISLGLGLHMLTLSGIAAYIVAFLLLVGYEMFEVIAHIEETRMNRTLDVVVGMTAFVLATVFLTHLSPQDEIGLFIMVTTLDVVLSFFGWRESRKAAVFEAKMKEEIAMQKKRIVRGRKLIKKKLHKAHGASSVDTLEHGDSQ